MEISTARSASKLRIKGFLDIYNHAGEGAKEKFKDDSATLINEYDECSKEPNPNPDNPVITVDTSCSIPPGAERHESCYPDGSISTLWYTLGGHNVGPYEFWSKLEDGSPYLANQSCQNVDGQLIGWQIWYKIVNGHRYDFFIESGSLSNDITMVNGIETYRKQYVEDGRLYMYCDCAGDGIEHFIRLD